MSKPAYPVHGLYVKDNHPIGFVSDVGMGLIDHFAGLAMLGILQRSVSGLDRDWVSELAYAQALSMMKYREENRALLSLPKNDKVQGSGNPASSRVDMETPDVRNVLHDLREPGVL
jgi:hypothetical protein